MFDSDDLSIDCATCIGAGTTACGDCIVTHLLANDDGPIGYVPVRLAEVPPVPSPEAVAVDLMLKAGLLGAEPQYVAVDEFESAGAPAARG
ncbi:MAG: hypothetical protein HKN44_05180 [Ilumatobacter sp.]|nr:hypothetical protein [Ilumatobacter sp.]